MSDLISRQAVLDVLSKAQEKTCGTMANYVVLDITTVVANLPSAQPKRKLGKWINHRCDDGHNIADCSVCGNSIQWFDPDPKPNYCPNCGAMLKEGEEHD